MPKFLILFVTLIYTSGYCQPAYFSDGKIFLSTGQVITGQLKLAKSNTGLFVNSTTGDQKPLSQIDSVQLDGIIYIVKQFEVNSIDKRVFTSRLVSGDLSLYQVVGPTEYVDKFLLERGDTVEIIPEKYFISYLKLVTAGRGYNLFVDQLKGSDYCANKLIDVIKLYNKQYVSAMIRSELVKKNTFYLAIRPMVGILNNTLTLYRDNQYLPVKSYSGGLSLVLSKRTSNLSFELSALLLDRTLNQYVAPDYGGYASVSTVNQRTLTLIPAVVYEFVRTQKQRLVPALRVGILYEVPTGSTQVAISAPANLYGGLYVEDYIYEVAFTSVSRLTPQMGFTGGGGVCFRLTNSISVGIDASYLYSYTLLSFDGRPASTPNSKLPDKLLPILSQNSPSNMRLDNSGYWCSVHARFAF